MACRMLSRDGARTSLGPYSDRSQARNERTTKLLRNKAQPARPIQQKSLRLRLIEGSSGLRLGRPGPLRKESPECLQRHRGAGGVLGGILELDMLGTGRIQSGSDRFAGQFWGVAAAAEVAQVNAAQAVVQDGRGYF